MDPKIDVETLINDKRLLLEQVRELCAERAALWTMHTELTKKLGEAWDQVYALTSEVNRLTELVTAAQVK